MTQTELLPETKEETDPTRFAVGRAYMLHLPDGPRRKGYVYYRGQLLKQVDLSEKNERQLLVIELMQQGVNQTRLAKALRLSRQTLHNYRESYNNFGLEGLLHGYTPSESKSRETQRRLHVDQRRPGTKARQLEQKRQQERDALPENGELDLDPPRYELKEVPLAEVRERLEPTAPESPHLPEKDLPFAQNHAGCATRYAGALILLFPLLTHWRWFDGIFARFGRRWRIFMIFLLMSARNIRSIEGLKHVRQEEAGKALGLGSLPSLPTIWGWFHETAERKQSKALMNDFFDDQVDRGLVDGRFWCTDGHLLPYTGKERVHYAYNTQRRMPVPGQTNQVTCDAQGRIVRFEIQPGKGDLRDVIVRVGNYGKERLTTPPIQVFDREGHGVEFFAKLVEQAIPFVTWEKHADNKRLEALDASEFTHTLECNGKSYRLLEQSKTLTAKQTEDKPGEKAQTVTLHRIVLWNLSTSRRASGLCWAPEGNFDLETFAFALLNRWGASENTFKHLNDRHPLHYRPGFGVSESHQQEIENPRRKAITDELKKLKTQLTRTLNKLAKTVPVLNKDGAPRLNSKHQQHQAKVAELETKQAQLREEKNQLPERIDVRELEDYQSFKEIDCEGKNLFDFVTASMWNARRTLIDLLGECYPKESDRVDLFYAILYCHGWIESDDRWVVIRLEPLQQPNRRRAQEQLCRKLTGLGAKIPGGKSLRIEVGGTPL
jgi:hypothetical protein